MLTSGGGGIQRFLGDSPDAGIDQAARLANSNESGEREFATELLLKIDTPKAREYLAKLAKDPDSEVATNAKQALSWLAQRPAKIPVDRFTRVN
jgi:HEAT repeat protein